MIITIENTIEGEELLNVNKDDFLNLYRDGYDLTYLVNNNTNSKKIVFEFEDINKRDIAYDKIKEALIEKKDIL